MTKKLKDWIHGSIYCTVEHSGRSNNNLLSLLIVKQTKDLIDIVDAASLTSVKELSEKIPKNIGISLTINTDKVLTKIVETSVDADNLLYKAFPAIKLSEFYYEIVQNKRVSLVSVCRKKDVNNILKAYANNGLQPLSFSLGNSAVFQLESYISNSSIFTSNAQVFFDEKGINKIVPNISIEKTKYHINEIELSNFQILAFGVFLQQITSFNAFTNFKNINKENTSRFLQKQLFNKGLYVGLGFLFLLLLINMVLYSFYQSKLNHWKQENNVNTQLKTQLERIQIEVSSQKKLIGKMFRSSGSKTTFFLDDLNAILPKTISLDAIQYQPLQKKIVNNKEIKIATNVVLIDGVSVSDAEFTNWINQLEQKKWVDSLVILDYGYKKKKTKFKIQIKIKDEW